MTDTTLHCPMCGEQMEITYPFDTYECPKCRAWFDMLSYGDTFKEAEE